MSHPEITSATASLLRRALNASGGTATRAFCFEMPSFEDGKIPEWIPFLPAPDESGRITGVDGRSWIIKNARALAAAQKRRLRIDINHSSDIAAPKGLPSPATGFIPRFEVRADGSTWAKSDWNKRGINAVGNKDYIFISPVFDHDENGVIVRFVGASLVNDPNFDTMPALNAAGAHQSEDSVMLKEILAALGLAETATADDAVRAINSQKTELTRALNAQQTDLTRFVPRADHDAVVARATNAEQQLKQLKQASVDAEIDIEIKAALEGGKITPATESYHRANCAREGGLEQFRAYVKAAPAIVDGQLTQDPGNTGRALNTEQQAVARSLGISDDDFKKANGLAA